MRVCCCAVASCAFPQAGKQTQRYPPDRSSSQATTCTQVSMHTYKAAPNLAPTHISVYTHTVNCTRCVTQATQKTSSAAILGADPLEKASTTLQQAKMDCRKLWPRVCLQAQKRQPLCKHLTNANETTTEMMWIQHRSHLARQEPSKQQTGYEQMSSAL
jgi:hypothetical protein